MKVRIRINENKKSRKVLKENQFWETVVAKVSGLFGTKGYEETIQAVVKFKNQMLKMYPPYVNQLEGAKLGLKDVLLDIAGLAGDSNLYALRKATPEEREKFKGQLITKIIKQHKASHSDDGTAPKHDLPTDDPYAETGEFDRAALEKTKNLRERDPRSLS